jgi:glycosyltransferase involved in cell wall biosynthesis
MNPKVSVVIPTYNRSEKVRSTIESVLAQSMNSCEVIVVDDGSADNTGHILRDCFGDRIRYHAQANQGVSVARNRGIEQARGEWIAFLDSDDRWESDKLKWQLNALDQHPRCDACYTDTRLFNSAETRTLFQMAEKSYWHKGTIGINDDVLKLLVRPRGAVMVVCLSSFLVRADLARKAGGFDTRLLYSQDSEFMFRVAMRTPFCYVNHPLVWFDRSPAESRHVGVSSQWNKIDFFLRDSQIRLEGLLRLERAIPRPVVTLVREQLRDVHSGWTNWYLERGEYAKARESASKAVRTDLTFKIGLKWLLTWMNPRLARRTVQHRRRSREASASII